MARKLMVSERDSGYPRQYSIESYDDEEYNALSWDDYYVNASGYFGNIGPHVFAAAPDLLEALEAGLLYIECCTEPDGKDGASSALKLARAALAKAKGEPQ